jgi:hypothetical protein
MMRAVVTIPYDPEPGQIRLDPDSVYFAAPTDDLNVLQNLSPGQQLGV